MEFRQTTLCPVCLGGGTKCCDCGHMHQLPIQLSQPVKTDLGYHLDYVPVIVSGILLNSTSHSLQTYVIVLAVSLTVNGA